MAYRVSKSDYEIWDKSKDGDLMYNIFNICKICKGDLRDIKTKEISDKKETYKVKDIIVDDTPICISCSRNDKLNNLWT